ncbi:hypothetical protein [Actinoplanes sp. NPDC026619]|uniref:hypothetical protein n=1 Tax=Actinoplanes sp. NPDC026619 TaxID=3155798 RepID=UPI0033D8131D
MIKFAAGLAVGYVLGSRAGREKYEQIVATARKAQNHPTVTQAQQKAKALLDTAIETAAPSTDAALPDTHATVPSPRPVPRPSRRQPKATLPGTTTTVDPLT